MNYSSTHEKSIPSAFKKTILYLVGEDKYFLSHRLPMARAAQKAGYHVIVACPLGSAQQAVKNAGFEIYPLESFDRSSINLLREINALWEIILLYRQLQPAILHHVGMKPVLYGSIAALFSRNVRVINALVGLGYVFISASFKAKLIRKVLTWPLRFLFNQKNATLILQNFDDQQTLMDAHIIKEHKTLLIRGSGVDPNFYTHIPAPKLTAEGPIIAFVGRMLIDKGVRELIEASKILQQRKIAAQFFLYGDIDFKNPTSFTAQQMLAWQNQGLINWKGPVQNSLQAYQNCHIAVLPSYREGLPKTLLEAASCVRPIVTTDTAGCREVVEDGTNGFLVPIKDGLSLANALEKLIQNVNLRDDMGQKGRQRVLDHFADDIISEKTYQLYLQQF